MTLPRWFSISLCAALGACSDSSTDSTDSSGTCSPSNVVDDEELVSLTDSAAAASALQNSRKP